MLASSRAPRGGANARGRDLRPKSRRCAAVGLRNAPAGAVNPAPTDKFCVSGQPDGGGICANTRSSGRAMALPWMFTVAQGPAGGACPSPTNLPNMSGPKERPPPTRTTVGRMPHPAAPRAAQTPRADMESAPTDKGERRATAGTARRPLTTPPPCTRGLFLSLFYKNTALYLSHLRGGAAIRQNFTTFRRRAGFSRQAIHGMIEPYIPLEGRGKEARFVAAIIRTVKLRKVYAVGKERVVALNDVDINIEKGEFCCIVGSPAAANQPCSTSWPGWKSPRAAGVHRQARDQRHERGPARPFPPGAPWLHFPELQPAAQHDGGRKRCPAADVQGRARQTAAGAGPAKSSRTWAWAAAPTTCPPR